MKAISLIVISASAAAALAACGPSSDTKGKQDRNMSKDSGMKGMDMKGMDMKGMDMKGMDMGKTPAAGTVHKATGKVTKVDASSGTVTIAHGPVASMKWPAMAMTFNARDKSMLDKVKQDAQVEFSFVESGKDYVITDIK